jgi:uncharacterized OB-fold protein
MANDVILAKKCNRCGTINHISKVRCLKCRGQEFTDATHLPNGTVLTFTNCTALPERLGERKSQGFALVLLEPGWKILGQVDNPISMNLGDKVQGSWTEISKNRDGTPVYGWKFRKEGNKI